LPLSITMRFPQWWHELAISNRIKSAIRFLDVFIGHSFIIFF